MQMKSAPLLELPAVHREGTVAPLRTDPGLHRLDDPRRPLGNGIIGGLSGTGDCAGEEQQLRVIDTIMIKNASATGDRPAAIQSEFRGPGRTSVSRGWGDGEFGPIVKGADGLTDGTIAGGSRLFSMARIPHRARRTPRGRRRANAIESGSNFIIRISTDT